MRIALIFLFSLLLLVRAAPIRAAETLHVLLTAPEATLDPARGSDLSSLSIIENIYEPPLRYAYLARPLQLQANTLSALPQVSKDGKTWRLQIQPGIYFSPHPAFGGKRRELQAADYLYSWQRLYDPALKSPWLFLLKGKLQGDAAWSNGDKFDYQRQIEGLQVLDRYTLQIRLQQPDPNFRYFLAMPAAGAVAHEAMPPPKGQVEENHPVGTGPYLLKSWQRSHALHLQANPQYRRAPLNAAHLAADPALRQVAQALEGKTLPRTANIEVRIIEEAQARVLGFFSGQFDFLEQVPPALAPMLLHNGKLELKPELRQRGVRLSPFTPLQTYYLWFNMQDPVIGGYTPPQIALRRALALAYDREHDIRLQEQGLAQAAQSPVPPAALGFQAAYRSGQVHDLRLANALLDHFGYKRDAQGWRTRPNGDRLILTMHTIPGARERDEVWSKTMQALGLRVEFKTDKKSEINKAARKGQVQMFETNWIADFPDAENFLQLLYGPNSGGANYAHFQLPAYDKLYEEMRQLPDGKARDALIWQMQQLIDAYNPWILRIHPLSLDVQQPWLRHYVRHPLEMTNWRYLETGR